MKNFQDFFVEAITDDLTFFYGSKTQNKSRIVPKVEDSPLYFTSNKAYAACYTFDWSKSEGFEVLPITDDTVEFSVPEKFKSRITEDDICSVYEIDGDEVYQLRNSLVKFASKVPQKVIREFQYDSPLKAMEKNGVKITYVETK